MVDYQGVNEKSAEFNPSFSYILAVIECLLRLLSYAGNLNDDVLQDIGLIRKFLSIRVTEVSYRENGFAECNFCDYLENARTDLNVAKSDEKIMISAFFS